MREHVLVSSPAQAERCCLDALEAGEPLPVFHTYDPGPGLGWIVAAITAATAVYGAVKGKQDQKKQKRAESDALEQSKKQAKKRKKKQQQAAAARAKVISTPSGPSIVSTLPSFGGISGLGTVAPLVLAGAGVLLVVTLSRRRR